MIMRASRSNTAQTNLTPERITGRNLALLNKTIYRFEIRLSGMSRTTLIRWEDLELEEASLSSIKKSRIKLSFFTVRNLLVGIS